MRRHLIALVLWLTLLAPPAWGLEIGGVTLPETLTLDGQTLVLNGAGLRKKFFVKVYAGGLYLTEKSRDAAEIIDADAPMVIRMHFIYDGISPEKLKGTWNEGFDNATGGNTAPLKKAIDEFNGLFTEEVKEGDVYDLIYRPGGGVSLEVGGKAVGRVPGLDFKRALFGIWLGDKPADKGLKRGMLGRD